jgi:hypothetical protein
MKQTLNEQVARIKLMMNLNEDDSQAMAMLQQETQEFNQKVGEDLTTEEYAEISCSEPSTEIALPQESTEDDKRKVDMLKEKMKTASLSELMQLKKQFKQIKKQQQNEQILSIPTGVAAIGAQNAVFLGISMSPMLAAVCVLGLGGLLLFLLGRLIFPRTRRETIWCNKPDRY